jgi:hypothetical protein
MYDEIFCEGDLPDGLRPEERHFQTKSLYTSHAAQPPALPSPSGNLPSLIADELPGIIHRSGRAGNACLQDFRNQECRRSM